MRKIKFRGKRVDTGEWVVGCYLETQMSGVYIIGSTMEAKGKKESIKMHDKLWQHEVIPETVGQYTGLKDKNGKGIYEGDIVKCTDGADEISKLNPDTGIGKIEWLEEWGFWSISNIENGLGDISNNGYVEVIGNIYENPELMA